MNNSRQGQRLDPERRKRIARYLESGYAVSLIVRQLKVDRKTVMDVKKELGL